MGTEIDIVEVKAVQQDGLVVIAPDRSAWLTFAKPWWDIASWLWYLLSPNETRWMVIAREGKKTRIRALKLASDHFTIGKP